MEENISLNITLNRKLMDAYITSIYKCLNECEEVCIASKHDNEIEELFERANTFLKENNKINSSSSIIERIAFITISCEIVSKIYKKSYKKLFISKSDYKDIINTIRETANEQVNLELEENYSNSKWKHTPLSVYKVYVTKNITPKINKLIDNYWKDK